jgi:hypothetical protein
MLIATYVLQAGAVFDEPNHPGIQPVHAVAATAAQIIATIPNYDHALDEFKTYSNVTETPKQQVLSAVDPIYYQDLEDDAFGFANVRIPAIITHLTTTYGTLTASDLKINQDKLTEAWNPDHPIENLWKNIKISQAIANQGGGPISNGTTIQLTLLALGKTGVHSHAIETWYNKDDAKHIWPNSLLHFNKHKKTCINKMTAQAARVHGAQNATRIPPDDQANASAAQQVGKSKNIFVSNGIPLFYCWTHSLSKTSQQTSKSGNNQSEGHCAKATIKNRFGGVNKISFSQSGKQRRVPTA